MFVYLKYCRAISHNLKIMMDGKVYPLFGIKKHYKSPKCKNPYSLHLTNIAVKMRLILVELNKLIIPPKRSNSVLSFFSLYAYNIRSSVIH